MKIDGRKCDRCGKLYVAEETGAYILTKRDDLANSNSVDLCPTCSSDLRSWFENYTSRTAIDNLGNN